LNGLMIASTFFIIFPPYLVKPCDRLAVSVVSQITDQKKTTYNR
jgi:hypothetical protein